MRRMIPVLTVLALVVALALAACGGSSGSGGSADTKPVPSPTLSAQQLVEQSLAVTGKQTSASFVAGLAVKAQGGASKTDAVTQALAGQGITLRAAGKMSRQPSATDMTVSLGLAGQDLQFAVKTQGAKAWIQYQGKWYVADKKTVEGLGVTPAPSASPAQPLGGLGPAALGVTYRYVGAEHLGGTQVYHVKATADPRKTAAALAKALTDPALLKQLGQTSTGKGLEKALTQNKDQLRKSIKSATADLWIGAGDMLVRKATVAVGLDVAGQTGAQGAGALSVDASVTLSGFGEPVTVTPPASALPVDQLVTALFGGLLGGLGGSGGLSF